VVITQFVTQWAVARLTVGSAENPTILRVIALKTDTLLTATQDDDVVPG
jgi:hypothetical protein